MRRWAAGIQASAVLSVITALVSYGNASAGALDDNMRTQVQTTTSADKIPAKAETSIGKGKFVVAPIPIVNPTLGNGLAGAALYTFDAGEPDGKTPRSTVGAAAAYTDTESWLVGAGSQLYLDQDRYRVFLTGGYGSLNLDYYGTSDDSVFFDNPVGFRVEGDVLEARLQTRIVDNLYAGALVRRVDASVSLNSRVDAISSLSAGFNLSGLGAIATYDRRDNSWYPETGDLGTLNIIRYASDFFVTHQFTYSEADYRHYWTLAKDFVLAADTRVAHSGDGTPFFMLPYVNFRGFPAGQYLSPVIIQGQAELRWMFIRKFGAVAFGGTGVAAPAFSDIGDGSAAWGAGIGVRYRLSEVDRMNAGFDVAYGSNDDVALYFRIGEAF